MKYEIELVLSYQHHSRSPKTRERVNKFCEKMGLKPRPPSSFSYGDATRTSFSL